MDNLDAILEVALNANYKTTLSLLKIYSKLSTEYKFWQLKCKKYFPDKMYYDLWTGEENYLVQSKNEFVIAIYLYADYNSDLDIDQCLYEDNPMLEHMYHLGLSRVNDHPFSYDLVKLNIQAQFIVMREAMDYAENVPSIIGQYISNEIAIEAIKSNWLHSISEKEGDIYPYYIKHCYCIIDLQYMIPFFTKFGKFRNTNRNFTETRHMSFYCYEYDNLVRVK